MNVRKVALLGLSVLLSAGVFAGCGDHGGNEDDGIVFLSGNAFFPPEVVAQKTPVAFSPFSIVDLQRSAANQVVFTGTTDEQGGFAVQLVQSKAVAVIVSGPVRVSGLVSVDPFEFDKETETSKEFNGTTDVACEAGVTAVQQQAITAEDLTVERIQNLELGAQRVLQTTAVNYFDPTSVTAAAAQVRALTDDGDHPPE